MMGSIYHYPTPSPTQTHQDHCYPSQPLAPNSPPPPLQPHHGKFWMRLRLTTSSAFKANERRFRVEIW